MQYAMKAWREDLDNPDTFLTLEPDWDYLLALYSSNYTPGQEPLVLIG
jgi:hypothetical protein